MKLIEVEEGPKINKDEWRGISVFMDMYSEYYPAVASRVVEKVVELPVKQGEKVHTLTLQPRHPGIVFEKIVVDAGGYQPQFLFGEESPVRR